MPDDLQVYCSRRATNGCEWKGKLLNLAHHMDNQNECPYQPVNIEPAHIRKELEMLKTSVRKAYRREMIMIVLVFLSLITAVGILLLSKVMTTTHEFTSKF